MALRRAISLCLLLLLPVSLCAQAAPGQLRARGEDSQAATTPAGPAALVERARQGAQSLTEKLPNFVCQQVTTRYSSVSSGRTWQVDDVVSAAVVIEDGKERYGDITVNGKPVGTPMEQLRGTWSTGEFSTLLAGLFAPSTQARFTYQRDAVQSQLPAAVYKYEVDQAHSSWSVAVNNMATQPAHQGTVWIHKGTARVLKIDMQAAHLPGSFPLSKVETTLEYEFIVLGGERFLLPVRSESVSCERLTPYCARNTIEFRDYHRFLGESTIKFRDPDKP